jgi:hypothetical protein
MSFKIVRYMPFVPDYSVTLADTGLGYGTGLLVKNQQNAVELLSSNPQMMENLRCGGGGEGVVHAVPKKLTRFEPKKERANGQL